MTIGWRTPGAWAAGSTTVTPGLPASPAAGDRMILFVGAKPYNCTINEPSGWTRIGTQQTNGSTAAGIDTGSVTWSVFYRDWQSGDAAPSVSITSGNVALACIHGATKTAPAWDTTTAYFGSDTSSGTGYSITAASSSGNITSGDGLIHASVIAGNNATFGTPTLTATGATIGTVTESPASEGSTATGNDLEASSASALCTAGTSSADAVAGWTLSVAQTGGSALVRLRENLDQTLTQSSRFDNSNAFYAPTATPGAVALSQSSRFDNSNAFYAPTVSQSSNQDLTQSSRFDNSSSFYAPTVSASNALSQSSRYDNSPTFYAPVVTPGAVSLSQTSRLDGSQSFYAPTVTPGAVALSQGSRLDNSNSFYAPTVTPAAVTLTPARYNNAQNFYAPTVTPGAVSLTQSSRLDNTNSFYAPTVAGGGQELTQSSRFDATNTFYGPTVTAGPVTLTQASRFDNAAQFYGAVVTTLNTLLPTLFANTNTFFPASVSAYTELLPDRFDNAAQFFSPTVFGESVTLYPQLVVNQQTFFGPGVVLLSNAASRYSVDVLGQDNNAEAPSSEPAARVTYNLPARVLGVNTRASVPF